MIIKSRGLPIRILKGEALQNRLPKNHEKPADIERDLKKRWKGYRGEQSLDYFLQFLPRGKYLIFHDLRLKGEQNFFQMDTLILSPFFALIIEVKNYSGTLIFDTELNQFTRINHQNKEEGFQDPIARARRQHL
ncbi:nuclease-related domain-containing protein [Heyndrickxia sporothermodurans]